MKDVKILVVDDSGGSNDHILNLLSTYQVSSTVMGSQAIDCFQQIKPDVLLLDLSKSTVDGLEFCRDIEAIDINGDIHIAVICANDSLKQRYYCYEAGVVDYFLKPFEPDDFCAKVRALVHIQQQKLLVEQANLEIVSKSLNAMEQYEKLVDVIKHFFRCRDVYEMVDSYFEFLSKFHLSGCMQIRLDTATLNLRRGIKPCSPIEEDLLEMVKLQGEVIDFDEGMALNGEHITVLIKNMIFGESEDQLRLKKFLELTIRSMEAKVQEFMTYEIMSKCFSDSQELLTMVEQRCVLHENVVQELCSKTEKAIMSEVRSLNLSAEQVNGLVNTVTRNIVAATKLQEENANIESQVRKVLSYFE